MNITILWRKSFVEIDHFREKGGVFLINIKFHLDFSKIGCFTGLLSRPDSEKLPSKFTIRVNRLAQAGYKVAHASV